MKNLIKLAVLTTIVVVSAFSFSSCSSVAAIAFDPYYTYGPAVIVVPTHSHGYHNYNHLPPPPRHCHHRSPYRCYRR